MQGTTEDQRHVPRGRVEGGASHSVEISAASKADQLTSGVQVWLLRDIMLCLILALNKETSREIRKSTQL